VGWAEADPQWGQRVWGEGKELQKNRRSVDQSGRGQGSKKEEVGWSVRLPCSFNALKRQPGRYITAASGAKMSVASENGDLVGGGEQSKRFHKDKREKKVGTLLLGSGGAIGDWIEWGKLEAVDLSVKKNREYEEMHQAPSETGQGNPRVGHERWRGTRTRKVKGNGEKGRLIIKAR
jgi:hypothetical protein